MIKTLNNDIMKKVLLVAMMAVSLSFAGCGKGDDDSEDKLTWIQTKIDFNRADDDGKGPEGQAFLFSLSGKNPIDLKPYVTRLNNGSYLCYLRDVNNEEIFSDYQKSFKSSKDAGTGKYINSSTITIYSSDISYHYKKDEEYLLVLYFYTPYLRGQMTTGGSFYTGGYTIAYKKIRFTNDGNIVHTHTFQIDPDMPPIGEDVIIRALTIWTEW